ncbi:hypothetical protein UFOVP1040_7 [uncultured Caudovirales phage]|uniref:Uncharacterized protein n=1 Tax=uncultured Caudovirales phage TaxID=2100421 RepID=A0A6J5QFH0_9CAUD|nr:hypothetical protein UFOVP1040_7 [uncultured Caudovirales phage]
MSAFLRNLSRRTDALVAAISKAQGAFAPGHKFFGNQYTVVPVGTVLSNMNFAGKPSALSDVSEYSAADGNVTAKIKQNVELTRAQYDALTRDLSASQPWLGRGQGGRDSAVGGVVNVTQVSAPGKRPLYINNEGYDYPRYIAYGPKGGGERGAAKPTGLGAGNDSSNDYAARVKRLERLGMSTSDAQSAVDAEDMQRSKGGGASRASSRGVKSNNEEWGFHGTWGVNNLPGPAAAAFSTAARALVSAGHFARASEARDYLDSTSGRHLADALTMLPAGKTVTDVSWLKRDVKDYKSRIGKAKGAYAPGHKFHGNQHTGGLTSPEQIKGTVSPVDRVKISTALRRAALKWSAMSDKAGVDARTIADDSAKFLSVAGDVRADHWSGVAASLRSADTVVRDEILGAIPVKLWTPLGFEPLHG